MISLAVCAATNDNLYSFERELFGGFTHGDRVPTRRSTFREGCPSRKAFFYGLTMHYYKRHIGDYAKKAGHLSPLEHGVYNLIIDSYYDREKPPTLLEAMRFARARTEDEKAAVLAVLDEFFSLDGDVYRQKRIDEELGLYQDKAETNRVIAVEREQRKRERRVNQSTTTTARTVHEPYTTCSPEMHDDSTSGQPNHKPLTTNQEPLTKNQEKAKSKASASGSRLPADWRPTDADIEYCKTERPDLRPSMVATNFYDYWTAKAGAAGRKADWSAAWRSWVRKENAAVAGRAVGSPVTRSQPDLDEIRRQNNEEAKRLLGFGNQPTTDEERTIDV